MPVYDELGKRMKTFYEQIPKTNLMRRVPVTIRIDGKAFHTYTRGFKKPFDKILVKTMQETTKYLCENIQGCVLGYTQSDEITLILIDYQTFKTDAWFNYEVQKLCSISASMATMAFNKFFKDNITKYHLEWKCSLTPQSVEIQKEHYDYIEILRAAEENAMFDARCFNIPKEEVTNLIYWRQLDATRNSIQMVGQAYFSHKELQHKNCNEIQDMLHEQKNINWNDFPVHLKRGTCVVKNKVIEEVCEPIVKCRLRDISIPMDNWIIDTNIPIFKNEGRKYIEELINIKEVKTLSGEKK